MEKLVQCKEEKSDDMTTYIAKCPFCGHDALVFSFDNGDERGSGSNCRHFFAYELDGVTFIDN